MPSLECFSLNNKHIVIVGASSGIGKCAAELCAKSGARVSCCARREDLLAKLLSDLPGENHGYEVLDVTNIPSIETVFDNFVEVRGRIDGMVYAAGIGPIAPLNVLSEKHWDSVHAVNLKGAVFCSKAAAKISRCSKDGQSQVYISSIAVNHPFGSGRVAYSSSKAGLSGAIHSIAIDGMRNNVRINGIIVGAADTDIWDSANLTEEQKQAVFKRHLLGIGDPFDIATACVYFLSPATKWVTGSLFTMDGGATLS